ncbi:MAG: substrate-binding domain-containing protein [Actinobacteria bacterium]|nr:substrate-binding domain-containing protein [Actinomycetota bacterium]MBU1944871.1 substrate-binding domain-containing protein [Actinomycetota bacterium]MBU2688075.1 substrate-binding domain-containing protein [Actinomycetota bacterium]
MSVRVKRTGMKGLVAVLVIAGIAATMLLGGCGQTTVTLATTKAMSDSGLLASVLPAFEKQHNVEVTVVPEATCEEALAEGRYGRADVVLVCDPAAEQQFVTAGYGYQDVPVCYSRFIIAGPESDPAGVRGFDCPAKSSRMIAMKGATYVSRSDGSDVHRKEMGYWKKNGVGDPSGEVWYIKTGQGMVETLKVASEKQGYVLVDVETWEKNKDGLNLEKIVEGCTMLLNQYGLAVSTEEGSQKKAAGDLVWYLTGKAGQAKIDAYRKYGVQPFEANAEIQTHGTTRLAPDSSAPAGGMKM